MRYGGRELIRYELRMSFSFLGFSFCNGLGRMTTGVLEGSLFCTFSLRRHYGLRTFFTPRNNHQI